MAQRESQYDLNVLGELFKFVRVSFRIVGVFCLFVGITFHGFEWKQKRRTLPNFVFVEYEHILRGLPKNFQMARKIESSRILIMPQYIAVQKIVFHFVFCPFFYLKTCLCFTLTITVNDRWFSVRRLSLNWYFTSTKIIL